MKIGILGSGQLGQMMTWFGEELDISFFSYSPNEPLNYKNNIWFKGEYDDEQRLIEFAQLVDIISYEFEGLPIETIRTIEKYKPIYPSLSLLKKTQDRLDEKEFLNSLNINTAPYYPVNSFEELLSAIKHIGFPSILKTRLFGYDGKGQIRIKNTKDVESLKSIDYSKKWVLEGFVNFNKEVSLIGARNQNGNTAFFPLVHNNHKDGILDITISSNTLYHSKIQKKAEAIMLSLMKSEDYVGIMTIEFFLKNDELIVNELACRVHNSGHWTLKGANISQFELHLKAIMNQKLPSPQITINTAMINVISTHPKKEILLKINNIDYVEYGKTEAPNRKLGHINILREDYSSLNIAINEVKKAL